MRPHEAPKCPWVKIGTDLFQFNDRVYMVTVDYLSNFWEVDHLENTQSKTVIRKLKTHFARYGIPDILYSDNCPQYSSDELQSFSKAWDFTHKTLSPGYSQSNGKVESAVKTAKRLMAKAKRAGADPYLALLYHRNTLSIGTDSSPAMVLMGRHTKTLFTMS